MMMWSDFVGCPTSYTQPLPPLPISEIISAVIKMHDPLNKNPLQSPSRMLVNKMLAYCTYISHCYYVKGENVFCTFQV